MGAKEKQPGRARHRKGSSGKTSAKVSARKRHRFYPDSIPPGMAAEVFDVSRVDDDGVELLDDEELVPDSEARAPGPRMPSKAPHPPRPSARPAPLSPDEVRIDTPLSYASNPAALLIDMPHTLPPAPSRKSSGSATLIAVAIGAALLALGTGMVVGRHSNDGPLVVSGATPARVSPVTEATPVMEATRVAFSPQAAAAAIDERVAQAGSCRAPGDPAGPVAVKLTVAQTGQVVGVEVGGALAGTAAGDCYAAALRDTRVPPFEGGVTTFERTVSAR